MDGKGFIILVCLSLIENVDTTLFFMCLVDICFLGSYFLPVFINLYFLISHLFDLASKHLSAAGVVSVGGQALGFREGHRHASAPTRGPPREGGRPEEAKAGPVPRPGQEKPGLCGSGFSVF